MYMPHPGVHVICLWADFCIMRPSAESMSTSDFCGLSIFIVPPVALMRASSCPASCDSMPVASLLKSKVITPLFSLMFVIGQFTASDVVCHFAEGIDVSVNCVLLLVPGNGSPASVPSEACPSAGIRETCS